MITYVCFGGPKDGAVYVGSIPAGYVQFGGSLVVWDQLNIHLVPMWQSDQFRAAVQDWQERR